MNQSFEFGGTPSPWDQIVRAAVHDMRTPLSSMLTALELLRQLQQGSEKSEQVEKLMALLERQVQTVSAQLEQLLHEPQAFLKGDPAG